MAISHVKTEPNICHFQYIYSTKNNDAVKRVLVVVKHGYEMAKRGFIRALLLVFPTQNNYMEGSGSATIK